MTKHDDFVVIRPDSRVPPPDNTATAIDGDGLNNIPPADTDADAFLFTHQHMMADGMGSSVDLDVICLTVANIAVTYFDLHPSDMARVGHVLRVAAGLTEVEFVFDVAPDPTD
jgi:hypothetical protein